MNGRDQAREEAAFLRGAVGVDGQATEEAKDAAEVEQDKARDELFRNKTYLGREFLTWLLWRSERTEPIASADDLGIEVLFVGRAVLKGIHGEVTELSAKGALAPYSSQVRRALDAGLLVHTARFRLTHGERVFEATVDAEHLDVKSAKLPELLSEEEDDRLSERLFLTEHLSMLLDTLVQSFLLLRASEAWAETLAELKRWMREGSEGAPGALGQASRATQAAG